MLGLEAESRVLGMASPSCQGRGDG
jgi:hypothetical protein